MTSNIFFDNSSPIISINQPTLLFKINEQRLFTQTEEISNNSLIPISQTEVFITNISPNYVAYRVKINRKKYYIVEPSHQVISPNSNIKIRVTFFYKPDEQFPPEGHRFLFEGVIIPNNMKYKDAKEIFEEITINKIEVEGNSIKKEVKFIFDNNYIFNSSQNIKLNSTQNLGSSIADFNSKTTIYSNALNKSMEKSYINRTNKLRGQRMEESIDIDKLKDECERLQNNYDNYVKELNSLKQKINNISSKNKFRYVVPNVNFSSVNKKILILLFGMSFFLGFYLTK